MKKGLLLLILVSFLINFIQAYFTPISEDEAYYWVWSQNLDWGYFDHPPMVAWWISIGYTVFQNELGVRFVTVLMSSLGAFLFWKTLNPISEKQIRLFFILYFSVVIFQLFGFLTTPDAPLLFFSFLYLFSLKLVLEKHALHHLLLFSISLTGLLYSKYHGILIITFTLLPIWKIWWNKPKFYLAFVCSLFLYTPHILWMYTHDFTPIKYHFLERSQDETFKISKLTNYLGMYFLGCAPLLVFFIWKSIFKLKPKNSFQISIRYLAILPGLFFLLSIFKDNVQPQWLLISFLAMAIITFEYFKDHQKLKSIYRLGLVSIIILIVIRMIFLLPSVSPFQKNKDFAKNAASFHPINPIFEKYQEASVYTFYNPYQKVVVHRTLGNRKSQYTIWGWEENLYQKNVTYISPWVKAENSFKGYKNREYFLKKIENYQTFELVEIKTPIQLNVVVDELIRLKIIITNNENHPIKIGKNSDLKLQVYFYTDFQYEIKYSADILDKSILLESRELKEIEVEFKNINIPGRYKACLGINYKPIGPTYLSKPLKINVE